MARVSCGGLRATGLPGPAGRVPWVWVWVCAVCVVPVRCVPWCWVLPVACPSGAPPLWCFVAVLRSLCACRAPFPARVPCSSAGYLPFLSWLRHALPFPLPSLRSPSSLACTFSLPPPWCVSRSFPLPASLAPVLGPSSFSPVGSCETEGGLGRVGLLSNQATRYHTCACLLTHVGAIIVAVSVAWHILYLCLHWCSYHGACSWRWRSCGSCGQACLLCYASSRVDGLQREGGGWVSWRFPGRRVRWRGSVVYVILFVHPWSFYPRGVRGSGFGLALPRHTLLVHACVCGHTTCSFCALGLVLCLFGGGGVLSGGVPAPVPRFLGAGRPSYHRFFPLGIPSYHSCSVPRCWRLLVLRVFLGGVHIFSGVGGFLPR